MESFLFTHDWNETSSFGFSSWFQAFDQLPWLGVICSLMIYSFIHLMLGRLWRENEGERERGEEERSLNYITLLASRSPHVLHRLECRYRANGSFFCLDLGFSLDMSFCFTGGKAVICISLRNLWWL